mmetsp:Transcript_1276/g.1431  ORF Transcript_1276/g.1431 Transcript_1276/m.1431 type:complete len:201 (+) Transcript_1276:36-638(+)|eukprot:CAMPEP_0205798920 /NCGR_PEP_ID=MMETSP0205-20121125/21_1 /ASSEMBLY_ACC=CAM_ASM_000278 /TAXON_ID=36767 /ORGANISM="Euplotes focardii, Strain TN1" /LENGTH=200 /DNA_ID=CAMNT_0053059375 /DNA_START=45 /DNA_END=647 /DNA_ORIENTATION=+
MKFVIAIAFALVMFTASASIQSFLKPAQNELEEGFPKSFYWNSTTLSPTGVPANATFRIDGVNKIFSYTLGYINTAFGRYTDETHTFDYGLNHTYIHTTGNDMCMKQNFTHGVNTTLDSYINSMWTSYARITKQWTEASHQFTQIDIPVSEAYNFTMVQMDNQVVSLNGTFDSRDFTQNITVGMVPVNFSRAHHIPQSCN